MGVLIRAVLLGVYLSMYIYRALDFWTLPFIPLGAVLQGLLFFAV